MAAADESRDRRDDQVCFLRTVEAFRSYERHARQALELRRASIAQLSPRHLELLGGSAAIAQMFDQHDASITFNQQFLNHIAQSADALYEGYWGHELPQPAPTTDELRPAAMDMDKVYSTLRQFVRDWSAEGASERATVYGPVLNVLDRQLPPGVPSRVLLPGAGLSRLSVEVAARGHVACGNEFSYHMLIAGHFAMNHCDSSNLFTIRPFCDATINLFSRQMQNRDVAIPDVAAYELMERCEEAGTEFGELSMLAGDFMEVFAKPEHLDAWDAVVTCFFIDTAHNIVAYLEILKGALKPGGLWLNAGPLLWHFSDQPGEQSVDLTYEEIKQLAARVGFDLVEEYTLSTPYTNNRESMKQMLYHCPMTAWRKRVVPTSPANAATVD